MEGIVVGQPSGLADRSGSIMRRRQRPATGERLARVWRTGVRHDLACPPTQQFVLKDLLTGKR